MKRLFDILAGLAALAVLGVPMFFIALVVRLTSPGPALYWSDRVGRGNKIFKMPKFRSMRIDTPPMATHLMKDPGKFLSPVGGFLRQTSLDELPQLLSIIRGDMSFVGPRPALFNQTDLISLRTAAGVHNITPGLTGWAQVNGRDKLSVSLKVEHDVYYLKHQSLSTDLRILGMTVCQALLRKGISH